MVTIAPYDIHCVFLWTLIISRLRLVSSISAWYFWRNDLTSSALSGKWRNASYIYILGRTNEVQTKLGIAFDYFKCEDYLKKWVWICKGAGEIS